MADEAAPGAPPADAAPTTAAAVQTKDTPTTAVSEAPTAETKPESEMVVESTEAAEARAGASSPDESRKRKLDDKDDGDWRSRRDQFQKSDRGRNGDRDGDRTRSSRGGRGSHSGRRPRDFSANVKSKYDDLPESKDPDEIRRQVEFYFSDSNLPTDKFLLSKVGGPDNNPVPISVLHSFKRMRHFQPFSAVVAALKESEVLDVTDDSHVMRKVPLPAHITEDPVANAEFIEDAARPRTVYAKGFGREGPTTQFDIEAFFAPYGPTNAIRLRRAVDKTFKGSVFVEFDTVDTATQFLELQDKPKWKGQHELKIMSKADYLDTKKRDAASRGARGGRGRGGRGGARGDRGRGRGGRGGRGGRRDRSSGREGDDGDDGDDNDEKMQEQEQEQPAPAAEHKIKNRADEANGDAPAGEFSIKGLAEASTGTGQKPAGQKRARDEGAGEATAQLEHDAETTVYASAAAPAGHPEPSRKRAKVDADADVAAELAAQESRTDAARAAADIARQL